MKTHKLLNLLIALVAVFAMMIGVAAVAADGGDDADEEETPITFIYDEEAGWVAAFADGRLNATDMLAPVAVYYDHALAVDDDGNNYEPISAIHLWVVDSEGVGQLALYLTRAEIDAAIRDAQAAASSDVVLGSTHGFTLSYSVAADSFIVSGNGYSFMWAAW